MATIIDTHNEITPQETNGLVANASSLEHDIPAIDDVEALSVGGVHAAFFLTSSTMTVHNDTLNAVTVDIPDSNAMGDNYPHESIAAGQVSSHDVSASWWNPKQSWFDVTFDSTHEIRTDLGSLQNHTNASPLYFDDGKVAVMVSPVVITPFASKFNLDFFVGPGTIPPLVNGFIQANISAILDHVNTKGILKTWSSGLSVGLSHIGMNPTDLLCSYASVSNVTSTSADVNVIMRLNNQTSFTGSFKYGSTNVASLTGSLTNFAVMLRLHADISSKVIEVKELKVSLDDYSIPVEFWILIAIINPPLAVLLKAASINANTFAMAVNTVANSKIIEAINNALKDALKGFALGTSPGPQLEISPSVVTTSEAAPNQDVFSTWMSGPDIQSKPLRNIHLPGSHDSGAYALTRTLPSTHYPGGQGIKYDDIKFLWALRPGVAPSNGNWPIPTDITEVTPLDVGQAVYNFIIDTIVIGVSQAGSLDIRQQLEGGIRWFDLRIYLDSDGSFYMQHGLRGPSFSDILAQVKAYIDAHPQSKELIFLQLSHADFNDSAAKQVSDLTKSVLSPTNLMHFPNDQGSKTFNFQTLAARTVASLAGGSTKVMLINSDPGSLQYIAPITNTSGFSGPGLWNFNWCTTPATMDIVAYVLGILQGKGGRHLEVLAREKNGKLEEALKDAKNRTANVVAVDWFQLSTGKLVVPQIIGLNH